MTVFKNQTDEDQGDHIIIRCDCTSKEHEIELGVFEEFKSIYFQVSLAKQPFFKRIWYAVKYIFGRQSDYGAFQEVLLQKEDTEFMIENLQNFLEKIK